MSCAEVAESVIAERSAALMPEDADGRARVTAWMFGALNSVEPPIMMLNAVHDPATPYTWARSVARQLGPKATLLTYAGSGHGVYNSGPCTRDAIDGYLISLKAPARGTVCPAVPQ